jgi:ectoine hydroxylase-related dioxygenase (phytanoyl-CoA dioxygenase family)
VAELSDTLDGIIARGPEGFAPGEHAPVSFRSFSGSDDPTSKPNWQIVNTWEAAPAFHRLIYHPKVVGAIAQLTRAADLMVWHDQVQYKPAEYGGATGWHQDAPLWPSVLPNTMVTAWIPMDDVEPSNGAMWMLPGSHTWGDQIATGSVGSASTGRSALEGFGDLAMAGFEAPAVVGALPVEGAAPRPCPVRRGQVHFHHSLTWHGSPENASEQRRRAIGIH